LVISRGAVFLVLLCLNAEGFKMENVTEDRKKVRLTADLPPDVAESLKKLAREQNVSVTEVLRRAIFTEKILRERLDAGSKILLESKDGKMSELIFAH
jgi:predicted transcriptional regulator